MFRYLVLLFVALLYTPGVQAQRVPVELSGLVIDYIGGAPLRGVTVRLLKAGVNEEEAITRKDGRYRFTLERGWHYSVFFSLSGKVTKHVVVDTRDIPPYPDVPYFEMDLEIALFDWVPDVDLTVFDRPLGEAAYLERVRNMSWKIEYTERLRPTLVRVMNEYEKTVRGYYKRTGRKPTRDPVMPAAPPPVLDTSGQGRSMEPR